LFASVFFFGFNCFTDAVIIYKTDLIVLLNFENIIIFY
jgi:hypothetical protein